MQLEFDSLFSEIIFYAALIILIVIILYFLYRKIIKAFKAPDLYGLNKEQIKKRWQAIELLINKGNEMSYKLAVMEADKLLDFTLKAMAMPGKDMGERLKAAGYKYPDIRQVWFAHKIRNQLVHEASYNLHPKIARRAIKSFEKALKDLNIL